MNLQIDRNKLVARAFLDMINAQGINAAVAFLADDVIIWSPGGTRNKAELLEITKNFESLFEIPLRITPGTVTAEDDRVAIEATSTATLKSGARYANNYHYLFRVRDGKIVEFREHHDTKHAAEVFG
jgi:ketosteroid isomerase-like protein